MRVTEVRGQPKERLENKLIGKQNKKKMKEMRKTLMLMLCLAVMGMSVTSCLSDDDNKTTIKELTPTEKSMMMASMAGAFDGYIYFINDSARLDSAAVYCSLTPADSVFTVHNFPYKILTQGVNLPENYSDIVNAAGEGILRDVLHLYANNAEMTDLYTFWAIPMTEGELTKKVTYEGAEHEVKVRFSNQVNTVNGYGQTTIFYPVGEYRLGEIIVYALLGEVEIDGNRNTLNKVVYFYGKK